MLREYYRYRIDICDDVTHGLREEDEMKLGWEMRAKRRLCALVGSGPDTVIWFGGRAVP